MSLEKDGAIPIELLTYIELIFFFIEKKGFADHRSEALFLAERMKRIIDEEMILTRSEARERFEEIVDDSNIIEEFATTLALSELESIRFRLKQHFAGHLFDLVKNWATHDYSEKPRLANSIREYNLIHKRESDIDLLRVLFGSLLIEKSPLLGIKAEFQFAILFTAEYALSLIPGVGSAIAIYEITSGETLLTNQKLSPLEKVIAGIGIFAEGLSSTIVRNKLSKRSVGMAAERIEKLLKAIDPNFQKVSGMSKAEIRKALQALDLMSPLEKKTLKKFSYLIKMGKFQDVFTLDQLKEMRRLTMKFRIFVAYNDEIASVISDKTFSRNPSKVFFDYGDSLEGLKGVTLENVRNEKLVGEILEKEKRYVGFDEVIRVPAMSKERVKAMVDPAVLEQAVQAGGKAERILLDNLMENLKMGDYILDRNTIGDTLTLQRKSGKTWDKNADQVIKSIKEKRTQANVLFVIIDNLSEPDLTKILTRVEMKLWMSGSTFRHEISQIFWISKRMKRIIGRSTSPAKYEISQMITHYKAALKMGQYTSTYVRRTVLSSATEEYSPDSSDGSLKSK